jgi:hypothetical protein
MHCLVFLLPAGVYYVFKNPTEGKIFLVLYAAVRCVESVRQAGERVG